ncbi:hypothetical protein EB230_17215 [Mesorhizobium sp. NZP2234]|uniref:hypothetical protein n=1 Tax=Mesorhizobium sp. NZP2234 TaxID=2483402 RepID=UPI001556DFD0|nr:hypothetical protein [Mesorhizobium sp. NZP2234]QKC89950.1 hypothetical protein EB230_17215 [Mesorhizobium sp. NZP2234]
MIALADLHAAAMRKADAAEAKVAMEQAALNDDLAYARENHQSMGENYWKPLHLARLKSQTARALAEAITEIMGETST